MVTTVGTESTFTKLVQNLLTLEHDAIAAYESTIERLENAEAKQQIALFKGDHDRHVQELERIATNLGEPVTEGGDMKQLLTTGKVAMASIFGDAATIKAMRTNEEDTVAAYERAVKHPEVTAEARPIFERALQDELRHRQWMEEASSRL
ncbi:DUF892 family protein [Teichococcus vastitatis]|jgi:rubrerythrin|uniref:Ferritin-like domain-containing protein n=1 Tax=Teichococcus vastitatis TaxID=2307076 RepID=A0ABS9W0B4_9PROT|nr:ferritin-like domain-containing protein [Pseudoroseomonas vastitatis]MCI0752295.1 ferritin-like domain-containing protein [Pseudoroseomonas vastitatis]